MLDDEERIARFEELCHALCAGIAATEGPDFGFKDNREFAQLIVERALAVEREMDVIIKRNRRAHLAPAEDRRY